MALDVGRDVVEPVVVGVERVDRGEREPGAARQPQGVVELAALQVDLERLEQGRPGGDRDRGPGLGERAGDREAEAALVADAGDQGALAGEIDREHGGVIARKRSAINRSRLRRVRRAGCAGRPSTRGLAPRDRGLPDRPSRSRCWL
jgi:hypothetical protein